MDIKVLGIETSCDETSAAIILNGREIISNVISTQIDIHKKFGGVVPEIASRKHVEAICNVVNQAIDDANMSFDDIDVIAATYGPGLVGALLVGLSYAKGLSISLNKPFVGVNHIEGHINANYIAHKDLAPPFVCLVVSGGHTHLVYVKDFGDYEIIGRTRDDAAGEAYDKVARAIGLGYPGGPLIDKLSKEGDKNAIDFPRAYLEEDSFDFSFSGLKSAVLNYINKMKMQGTEINNADVAASFQQSVVEILVEKSIKAVKSKGVDTLCIAGGVASNSELRHQMGKRCKKEGIRFLYPPTILCTDNAAMVACAAYYDYLKYGPSKLSLNAVASLKIGERCE